MVGVTPKEIIRDIVPYRLYLLYHETENEKAAPWAAFYSLGLRAKAEIFIPALFRI